MYQLMLGAYAPGAEIPPPPLATCKHPGLLYIGHPAPLGVPLGMADIVTEHG